MMMYTGRRLTGAEALAIGLVDYLVPQDQVKAGAMKLASLKHARDGGRLLPRPGRAARRQL